MRPFAVIGIGRFGRSVVDTLASRGAEVLAVDRELKALEPIRVRAAQTACLDATDEAAMRAAGLDAVETAVVAIGEQLEVSVLATALLRKIGVPRIVARAISELHGTILESVGATRVVRVEEEAGAQLAQTLLATDVRYAIPLASGHSVAEVYPRPEFIGRTLRELDLRGRYRVNVVAIKRRVPQVDEQGRERFEHEINDLPSPEDRIEETDTLVVIGSDDQIADLATE